MNEMVVCDSAPLIHLSSIGRLDLLKDLFREVKIPDSVYREVVTEAKALHKPGVRAVENALEEGWIAILGVRNGERVENLSRSEGIEIDDAEVICLALELSEELVTSDGWLVKVAITLGVRVFWTTTLVLMSVKRGIINRKDALQLLRDLVNSGLYLRTDVYAAIINAMDGL